MLSLLVAPTLVCAHRVHLQEAFLLSAVFKRAAMLDAPPSGISHCNPSSEYFKEVHFYPLDVNCIAHVSVCSIFTCDSPEHHAAVSVPPTTSSDIQAEMLLRSTIGE
eukprot:6058636-Amphidinium_carterae.1